MGLGMLVVAIASLWLIVTAFSEGIIWGLLTLFTGVGAIAFIILHWDRAKRPFGWALLGGLLSVVAAVLLGGRAALWF